MSKPINPDDAAALAANLKKLRARTMAELTKIRRVILAWLEPRASEMDSACLTIVLLDIALDRHIALYEDGGFDRIEAAYRRAVERWRGTLQ